MTISMLDQMLFMLGHTKWTCEQCGKETDLSLDPFKAALAKDLDTAEQIDLQHKERGQTVERLG